jgi:hypothetical protein
LTPTTLPATPELDVAPFTLLILTPDTGLSGDALRVRVQGGAWNNQLVYILRTSVGG